MNTGNASGCIASLLPAGVAVETGIPGEYASSLDPLEAEVAADRGNLAKIVFSAKECFYKCQSLLSKRFLGFHDVELEVDPDARRFVAKPLVDLALPGSLQFEGRWNRSGGHVITAMALQAG